MKKILSIILALCMVLAMAACGASDTGAASSSSSAAAAGQSETTFKAEEPAETEEEAIELPRFKICLAYTSFTDKLGSQMKASLEYLADAFNVEFVFLEVSNNTEEKLAAFQSVAESGVDGIIAVGLKPAYIDGVKGVPMVAIQSEPTNDEQAQELACFENYLGAVCENDYESGREAAASLYEQGCRNFCLAAYTKGVSKTHEMRTQGFKDFLADKEDAKLLAEDYSAALWADAIAAFAASYPEMDGFYCTSGGESVYQAMRTEGLAGNVKLACFNVSESTGDYIESGDLSWICGGQYGTTQVGFAILYNYLIDGTRIIEDTTQTMYRPLIYIPDMEAYNEYIRCVDSGIPVYTGSEVKNMIHAFNEEANYDYFMDLAANYNLADIAARHADILG